MNTVCSSFCSKVFLELTFQVFLELTIVLEAHVVLCMTEAGFLKIMLFLQMGNIGQDQGSLNV